MKKDSFLMSADWAEAFALLPVEDAGMLIKAIYAYNADGTEPEDLSPMARMVFSIARPFFDDNAERYRAKCEKLRENGSQPKGEKHEEKANASSENSKKANAFSKKNSSGDMKCSDMRCNDMMCSEGEGEESACAREDTPSPAVSTEKHTYGTYENVLLTEQEYASFLAEYPDHAPDRIDKLSEYLHDHPGKSYRSHYDRLRRWAKEDHVPTGLSKAAKSYDLDRFFVRATERGLSG